MKEDIEYKKLYENLLKYKLLVGFTGEWEKDKSKFIRYQKSLENIDE